MTGGAKRFDLAHAPPRAQRFGVPLLRCQGVEPVGEPDALRVMAAYI
jgi:hypothetical protein